MSLGNQISRKLADVPQISSLVGIFVEMAGSLARINLQGSTVDIRCDGWNPPLPGMPVRVEVIGSRMRVVGPTRPQPAIGTVVESIDGGVRAVVEVDGEQYTLPVMAPYSPLATDEVVIHWPSGYVLGEKAAPPPPPPVEPPTPIPPPPVVFKDLVIQPTASGKYDLSYNNWWSPPEVWASNNNKGIWTYGGRFRALAGASGLRAEFFFPTPFRAVGAAYIGLHPHPQIPGGAPSISELFYLQPGDRNGWYVLPSGWAEALRDNPDWGIGVTSGAGDNRWPGVGQAGGSQSGWLRFSGTR